MKDKATKKKKNKISLLQKRNLVGYVFILPWFVGFLAFYVRSILLTGEFAFCNMTVDKIQGGYTLEYTGLDNIIYAFTVHPEFKQVLTSSVGNMLIDVPLIIFFSLFMAILLNRKFPGRGLVRCIFFLPVILASGAISEAMELSAQMINGGISDMAAEMTAASENTLAFSPEYLINLFTGLGIPASLLGYIASAVGRINEIIKASGVQIVIFIAALQSIPTSMYEVAKIEGATAYETFWKVTFPMVMPHIITNIVYTIVDSFTESEVVELAYNTAFTEYNYGLSSVFSLVSTVITCLILILVCGYISKKTFYYN